MKNKKNIIFGVQYILLSFLSFLCLPLSYISVSISVSILDDMAQSKKMTGWELLKILWHKNSVLEELFQEYIEISGKQEKMLSILIIITLMIPLILVLVNAALHVFAIMKEKISRKLTALPILILLFNGGGLFFTKIFIKTKLETLGQEASGAATSLLGSKLGNLLSNAASNLIEIKIAYGIGAYFFLAIIIILLLEDTFFPLWKKEKEEIVPDAVYRHEITEEKEEPVRNITTWNDADVFSHPVYSAGERQQVKASGYPEDPTRKERACSGMLIGLRGEYAGAEIRIQKNETIFIGRSRKYCSLILSNSKVSRKHCSISYDETEKNYLITNYSLNGTYLSGGQLLKQDKIYHLPPGTIFRVDEEDEFRVL